MDGSDGIVDEHAQTTRGSLGDTVSNQPNRSCTRIL
jgi:hypothetical protein